MFELTNKQREYLGLDPVPATWDKVPLKGDTYRPDSIIYFDKDVVRRHIVSTENDYKETQYNESTRDRKELLPKTSKGKPKKLSASTLESRHPIGVYFIADKSGAVFIGNHTTQTTFYSSNWDKRKETVQIGIAKAVDAFISESPENHLDEIRDFKNAKRKNVRYRAGDVFAFKISRTEYGFGIILLDINLLRRKKLLPENHGLFRIMGPPVLVAVYAFVSTSKNIDISSIIDKPQLPSDIMMDNHLFYGEYEIIGHHELNEGEFEFPISYGCRLDRVPNVFLQWGLIHLEKPTKVFNKYLKAENQKLPPGNPSRNMDNPFGYYGVGFRHRYDASDIKTATENNWQFDYDSSSDYKSQFDLRNPVNDYIRADIFRAFGLNPNAGYDENRQLTNTPKTTEILKSLYNE